MKIDPVLVSLISLGVACISLLVTLYRASVDRKLQWEQMRGASYNRLTFRAMEIFEMIEKLRLSAPETSNDLIGSLLKINEGIVKMRSSLYNLTIPSLFGTSWLITSFARIKSDLDDTEPIFESLHSAIKENNIPKANTIVNGLLERIYGNNK